MSRENLTNFASTTLALPLGPTDTSLTVLSGTGSRFPVVSTAPTAGTVGTLPYTPRSFVVLVGSELIECSANSSDVFTLAQHGFDGTTATSHATGAVVTVVFIRDMYNRLWSTTADTFNPDVPPYDQYQNPTAPNGYSDEFDSQTNLWTTYPITTNLGGSDAGASLDFGATYRSNIFFQRLTSSTTTYWIYQPVTISGATAIKWKWQCGFDVSNIANSTDLITYTRFFISDRSNPTATLWSGNGLALGLGYDGSGTAFYAGNANTPIQQQIPVFQATQASSNAYQFLNYATYTGQHYGALTFDGTSIWTFWVGDGMTWTSVASANIILTPLSMGFRFEMANNNSAVIGQSAAIDWIRVGTTLYGN